MPLLKASGHDVAQKAVEKNRLLLHVDSGDLLIEERACMTVIRHKSNGLKYLPETSTSKSSWYRSSVLEYLIKALW